MTADDQDGELRCFGEARKDRCQNAGIISSVDIDECGGRLELE